MRRWKKVDVVKSVWGCVSISLFFSAGTCLRPSASDAKPLTVPTQRGTFRRRSDVDASSPLPPLLVLPARHATDGLLLPLPPLRVSPAATGLQRPARTAGRADTRRTAPTTRPPQHRTVASELM